MLRLKLSNLISCHKKLASLKILVSALLLIDIHIPIQSVLWFNYIFMLNLTKAWLAACVMFFLPATETMCHVISSFHRLASRPHSRLWCSIDGYCLDSYLLYTSWKYPKRNTKASLKPKSMVSRCIWELDSHKGMFILDRGAIHWLIPSLLKLNIIIYVICNFQDMIHVPVLYIIGAFIPATMIAVLYYFDHSVASQLAQQKEYNLRKPPSFHYDLFLLGFMVWKYPLYKLWNFF